MLDLKPYQAIADDICSLSDFVKATILARKIKCQGLVFSFNESNQSNQSNYSSAAFLNLSSWPL